MSKPFDVPTVTSLTPTPTPPDNFSPVFIFQIALPVFKSNLAKLPSDDAAKTSSPIVPGENSKDSEPSNFADQSILGLSLALNSLRYAGGSIGSWPIITSVS